MRFSLLVGPLIAGVCLSSLARGATYQVGPARALKTLADVAPKLAPGDVVELDGGATYPSVWMTKSGTQAQPITIRGVKVGGKRPVMSGGDNTLHLQADWIVLDGLEVTAGAQRCIFHHGHAHVYRDLVVHHCPNHGILSADNDSGSLTVEYSEIHHCGSGDGKHQIYASSDEVNHPGSVFRLQHTWLHDATGGINVKSRAERNELYYNWSEGALYYDADLIGSQEYDPGVVREDSDVVGNVFVRVNEASSARFGGDGTGESFGRVRVAFNLFVTQQKLWGSPTIRLRDGLESIELHSNVFWSTTSVPADIFRDVDVAWVSGRKMAGSNNWVQTGAQNVPSEWTGTIRGTSPGFTSATDFTPAAGSPLVDRANLAPVGVPGSPFPKPLVRPLYQPARALQPVGSAKPRGTGALDIGALESGAIVGGSTSTSTSAATSTSTGATVTSGAGGSGPATDPESTVYFWPIAGASMTLAGFLAWLGSRVLKKKE